jgi:hypothetical protein
MISIEQTPAETRPDQILSRPSTVVSMHGEGTEPERPRGCLQCIHGTDTYLPTYLPNLPVMSGAWDATGRKRCNTCPKTEYDSGSPRRRVRADAVSAIYSACLPYSVLRIPRSFSRFLENASATQPDQF